MPFSLVIGGQDALKVLLLFCKCCDKYGLAGSDIYLSQAGSEMELPPPFYTDLVLRERINIRDGFEHIVSILRSV